jgi:hypothetical protein
MKKNIFIGSLALCMALLSFSACNDTKFLAENPLSFYTTDNIISSPEQVNQLLTTSYARVRELYCESGTYRYFRRGVGTDMYDCSIIRQGDRLSDYSILNAATPAYNNTYSFFYVIINSANTALYWADQVEWGTPGEKAYTVAQARFIRAFAYRHLGEVFGGVPLVTELTTAPRYDYTRASQMETYQFAIDEMEAILNDLPETTPEAGRLVRAAAQHNLCQLYIDKGVEENLAGGSPNASWQTALRYADGIIDGGTYSLMTERFGTRRDEKPDFFFAISDNEKTPETRYSANGYEVEGNVFWDLFQKGNQDYQDGNREAIWCAQSDYAIRRRDGNGEKSGLNYAPDFGPVFRDQASGVVSGQNDDVGGVGMVGTCIPTAYSRDLVYEDKWGDDLRNSEAVLRRVFYGNVRANTEYYGKQVPWDVLYRVEDGKVNDAAYTELYPISCKIAADVFEGVADGEPRYYLFRDEYLIRLPETILLRAEVKWRLGDNAGAAADINLLRARAKCGYMVTAADVNADLILDERARELLYEECRWITLLRFRDGQLAAERIKKYSYWDYPRNTLNKEVTLWPIPQTVIDTNKDKPLAQNPGW